MPDQGPVLLTGGAGFIGRRLLQRLRERGRPVVVVDALIEQVHGPDPEPLPEWVTFHRADVADAAALDAIVREHRPSALVHLAAETGTGQSMDELTRYCTANVTGTAVVLEALARSEAPVDALVLASSRAVYGEGSYAGPDGAPVTPPPRDPTDLREGVFSILRDGEPLRPVPTREDAPPSPCSVYASTKLMQEYLVEQAAAVHGWPTRILRFQNVYGDGQSLRNPYTGVLSIFVQQIAAGRTLNIFEDGGAVRDFVYVDDVARAVDACLDPALPHRLLANVGSGAATDVLTVARTLLRLMDRDPDEGLRVTGDFRVGDIRHAVADVHRARDLLAWTPTVPLEEGLRRLIHWARAAADPV